MPQKQNILKVLLIAVFCLMIFAMAGEADATLIWDASFTGAETWTGKFVDWGAWDYPCSYNSAGLTLMDAFGRSGKYMTKMVVNPSTTCFGVNDISTQRIELEDYDSIADEAEGTDRYYGWSFYLPSDFVVHAGDWKNIAQWHQTYYGMNPVIRLTVEDNYLKLYICAGDVTGSTGACPANRLRSSVLLTPSQLTRSEWHDIVIRVKFSATSGITEFWHKTGSENSYTKVHSQSGLPTLQYQNSVTERVHFRAIGNYRGPATTDTDTIYVMNYKIGTAFDDVEYGGSSAPDTTPPSISITCPLTGQTYSSQTISVSGSASDNVGVSKVEVKVGSAGTYQAAAGATSWSISGVTLAAGLNTVYARATDTSGNTKETSIQVTYDSSVPPPPTVFCTKFVAKNGNDANPGTEAQPFLTIQKAANVAVAGDTVCVKSGTYNERVEIKNSGTPGNWITFMAYPGHTVTIDGTGVWPSTYNYEQRGLVHLYGKSYVKISGFRIVNVQGAGVMLHSTHLGDGSRPDASAKPLSYITVEKNYIYNTYSSAVGMIGVGNNIIIDGNEGELISNPPVEWWSQEQISLCGSCGGNGFIENFEIKNNELHHSGAWYDPEKWRGSEGIDAKGKVRNGKIYGNHVHHLGRIWDSDVSIYVDGSDGHASNIDIYNNIVHDIKGHGIVINAELPGGIAENINIYNNIVYNVARMAYYIEPGSLDPSNPAIVKDVRLINNVAYKNDPTYSKNSGSGGFVITAKVSGYVIRNNIAVADPPALPALYLSQNIH